jgi:hypothetical protein
MYHLRSQIVAPANDTSTWTYQNSPEVTDSNDNIVGLFAGGIRLRSAVLRAPGALG